MQPQGRACGLVAQNIQIIAPVAHGRGIDALNYIAGHNASLGSRRTGKHRRNQHAARIPKPQGHGRAAIHILQIEAQPQRGHPASTHKVVHDPAGLVDGYGKTYALGAGVYRCIDTYKHTLDVQQWAAAVAGVNGGICLHKVGKSAVLVTDGTPKGRNHAGCDRVVKPKRVANGDDRFTGHDIARIAQLYGWQLCCPLDLQYGDVKIRIGPFYGGRKLPAVQQMHHDFVTACNNVRVGEHKTFVAVYNHPRAEADALLFYAAASRHFKTGQTRKPRAKKFLKG